jgi:hypothetical protein
MRRGWKRLAERAANAAFDDSERRDALAGALQGDWRNEVEDLVGRLRDVLDDHQGDLFGESVTERLEALRGQAAGCPLAGAVLDFAARAADQGYRGNEALAKAARDALLERAASGRRQVEEHWLRTSSARSAGCVRNRIDGAIAASDMDAIARRCIGYADEGASRTPRRKTGIDDGVSLS